MSEIPQGTLVTDGQSTQGEFSAIQHNFADISNEKTVLDRIEESVKSLQTRIQHLLKEKCRNEKKLEQAFQDSVGLVQRKMQQVSQKRQINEYHRKRERQHESNQMRVKQLRHRQNEEMAAVKESLGEIKKEQRDTIREMSRKNQQIIDESRRQLLDKKRHLVQQLRQDKENSRLQHQKQRQQIKQTKQRQKEQQQRIEQQRKTKLLLQLKMMQSTERQLLDNIRLTSSNINQFSSLTKVTSNMTVQDFEDMLKDVKKEKGNNVTQKILQYILTRRMEGLKETKKNTVNETRASSWKKEEKQLPKEDPTEKVTPQETTSPKAEIPPRPIILSPQTIDS